MSQAGPSRPVLPDTLGEGPMAHETTQASVNNGLCAHAAAWSIVKAYKVPCSGLTPMLCDYPLLSDEGQVVRTAGSTTGWLLLWPVCVVGCRAPGVCFPVEDPPPVSRLLH